MASRLADLERYWGQAMDKYLVKHGIGEDLVMGMAGQPVEAGRQPKHQEILMAIFNLKEVVDRYYRFLDDVRGQTAPPDKQAQPDGPDVLSLAEFMGGAGSRIMSEVERLDQCLSELRLELF